MELNVVEIPISAITVGNNVRFGLKATRVETMAEDIKQNGILNPLTVVELKEPVDGHEYRVLMGNYRWAAVNLLNAKENANILTLPCVIREETDPIACMKLQLSENNERENMTPMDKACAIRDLLAAEVPKQDIRALFATPGGRKGMKVQAASNSHINMLLSFLDFPKAIQNKIHDGLIPVQSAYQLRKAPREKWESILAEVEAERIKQIDREEADEKKLINESAKMTEAEEKAKEAEKKAQEMKEALEKAKQELHEKSAAYDKAISEENEARKAALQGAKDNEEKAKQKAAEKAAQDAAKEAEKAAIEAKKAHDKLMVQAQKASESATKAAEAAEERRKRLQDARAQAASTKRRAQGVSASSVQAAASRAAGEATPLNSKQIKDSLKEWILPGSYDKVREIAEVILNMISGEPGCLTSRQAYTKVSEITGYLKPGKADAAIAASRAEEAAEAKAAASKGKGKKK